MRHDGRWRRPAGWSRATRKCPCAPSWRQLSRCWPQPGFTPAWCCHRTSCRTLPPGQPPCGSGRGSAWLWLEEPGGRAHCRLAGGRRHDPAAPGPVAACPRSGQAGLLRLPAKLLRAGHDGRVREDGTITSSSPPRGERRNGRVPWPERHPRLAGRAEGPRASGGPAGPWAAGCGCVSSLLLTVGSGRRSRCRHAGQCRRASRQPVDADVVDRR